MKWQTFYGLVLAEFKMLITFHVQVTPMKRFSGYLVIIKLLLSIYWLVTRQWLYLGYRRLFHRGGRRAMTAS